MGATHTAPTPEVIHAGQIIRQELGSTEIQRPAETAAAALAAREAATIRAMFIVADGRPRSVAKFEQGIVAECLRPGFADIARYCKPVGKKRVDREDGSGFDMVMQYAEGWSIRFAEAAMRHWTNVFCDAKVAFEDDEKRIVRMVVMDLESNITVSSELNLSKRVERRGYKKGGKECPPDGREVLGERQNSYGDTVYIVAATDDELNMKQAAAWSKFTRRVVTFMPGDILDRCEMVINKVLSEMTGVDAVDKLVAAFEKLRVKPTDLQAYLGHALRTKPAQGEPQSLVTTEELAQLRKIHAALKEGEATWADFVAAKEPEGGSKEEQAKIAAEKIEKAKNTQRDSTQSGDGGEPKSAGAETSAQQQQPAAEGTGKPSGSPTPEPKHFPELRAYRELLGDETYNRILGNAGFESFEQITAQAWPAIEKDLQQAAADAGKDRPRKQRGLNLK